MYRLSSVVQPLAIAAIVCTTVTIASPFSRPSSALAPTADSDQLACFSSNPDIAGIGVRVSTYAQSFLLFFTTLLCIAGGHLDSRERKALEKSYTNLLITACALLISAFIEAVAHQLSIYHALLVLDWSWMLTANALLLSILPTIDSQINKEWSKRLQSALPSRIGQIPAMTFVSLHMSLMGAFGVYVWWKPGNLRGPTTEASLDSALCLQNTLTYIFFRRFRVSSPKLRIVSIVCYFFVALPFVNVLLLTAAAVVVVNVANALICKPYTFGRLYRVTWIVQTSMNVIIAVNTELSIIKNSNLIITEESTWGFGQILAVVLIFSPLLEALSVVKDKLQGSSRGRVTYQFQRFLRKSEEQWGSVYSRETKVINDLVTKLKSLDKKIESHALRAIIGALESAGEFFEAANTILESSSSPRAGTPDSEHEQQRPQVVLNAAPDGIPGGESPSSIPGQSTAADSTQAQVHLQGQPVASGNSTTTPDGALANEIPLGQTPESMTDATAPVGTLEQGNSPGQNMLGRTHTTAASRLETAKRDLTNLWERMSKTCEVRFPVSSAESFLVAKAYLRATEAALGAAIIALEPLA